MTRHPHYDKIWLIGLMGAGKSTVGRALAAELSCEYLDNDLAVAGLAGRSTVLLAQDGGTVLHDWESRYVGHIRRLPGQLVAGIPASTADRREDLKVLCESGLLVYLRCDAETLIRRVAADEPRPWLTADPAELINGMMARRDPVLATSAALIADGTKPAAETVRLILNHS
jgi:shikimate kinase